METIHVENTRYIFQFVLLTSLKNLSNYAGESSKAKVQIHLGCRGRWQGLRSPCRRLMSMSPLWFSSRGGTCEGGNVIWLDAYFFSYDTRSVGPLRIPISFLGAFGPLNFFQKHREMQGNREK